MGKVEKSAETIKQEYLQKKGQILALLEETQKFYQAERNENRAANFADLYKKLQEGVFSIVVVGEFSTGKSTLLNAIMGKKLLPSFTNETTATINFLRYKDKAHHGEAGIVYYNDGRTFSLPDDNLATIEKYVSTKGTKVAAEVHHLDLFLDSNFLKDGVMLVDSPGLNGIAEGHREITEDQIRKSHASIFLFSSDHPGSKTDFEMLDFLSERVNTIFFVLNKIDVIRESEGDSVEKVIQGLKNSYHSQFPEAAIPEFWPVSAYNALRARDSEVDKDLTTTQRQNLLKASRLPDFESRLLRFLTQGEKAKQELMEPVNKVITSMKESRENYEENKKTLVNCKDGTELQEKIDALQNEICHLDKERSISSSKARTLVRQEFKEVRNELSTKIEKYTQNKLHEIENIESMDELNDYIQGFEQGYIRRVERYFQDADQSLLQTIEDIVNREFTQSAEAIEVKLAGNDDGAVHISLKNHVDTSERDYDVDFNVMDAQEEKLKKQLKQLQGEKQALSSASADYDALLQNEMELKNRLTSIEASIECMRQYQLPSVTGHIETRDVKRKRDGLLGRIGNVLIGDKVVQKEEWVQDEASIQAHEEAKRMRNQSLQENQRKNRETQDQLEQIQEKREAIERERSALTRKSEEIKDLRQEIKELREHNVELANTEMKKLLRKTRNTLKNQCYQIQDEVDAQVKEKLQNVCDAYATNVVEAVQWNLKDVLEEKKRQQENLQKQLNSSVQDRNKQVDLLTMKIDQANQLLEKAVSLQELLDASKVDKIRKEV